LDEESDGGSGGSGGNGGNGENGLDIALFDEDKTPTTSSTDRELDGRWGGRKNDFFVNKKKNVSLDFEFFYPELLSELEKMLEKFYFSEFEKEIKYYQKNQTKFKLGAKK